MASAIFGCVADKAVFCVGLCVGKHGFVSTEKRPPVLFQNIIL